MILFLFKAEEDPQNISSVSEPNMLQDVSTEPLKLSRLGGFFTTQTSTEPTSQMMTEEPGIARTYVHL